MDFLELRTSGIVDAGCFSVLWTPTRPLIVTLERTFEDNRVVLPAGRFLCRRGMHQLLHGDPFETFEITGVPGHSGVLFHKGNKESASIGCVLTGSSFGLLAGDPAVLASGDAFDVFMAQCAGLSTFWLSVIGR